MPNLILKKTFKIKPEGFQVAADKTFSFHGRAGRDLIDRVNRRLATFRLAGNANRVHFKVDTRGHYAADMNHDCQKYHEEDVVVLILDEMEENGWQLRFEYEAETTSHKTVGGGSKTPKELFMFHR